MPRTFYDNSKRTKINISFDIELLGKIDEYAKNNYMSRTAVITQACTQLVMAQEVTRALSKLAISMQRIADTQEIDEQSKKELESFKALAYFLAEK